MTKTTRGRPSKIDLLPQYIRDELHKLLRDRGLTQQDIRAAVNELIDEHGLSADMKLSRTGLNRYATRMEEMGAKIRQSREVAEAWTAKLGDAPTSDVGKLLQEIVRTLAFETSMHMSESDKAAEPKALAQMALAIQRVEQAAMASHKREREIREAFAAEVAESTEHAVRSAGMSAETAQSIKQMILGIA
ncbi:DUF3486 family protein [Gilliamella sp. CG22]|uniref:DUF3486 family protein n=1 Tax=Gilliamella sp. CG22 TaxID=3351504 RepID=UPI003986915D